MQTFSNALISAEFDPSSGIASLMLRSETGRIRIGQAFGADLRQTLAWAKASPGLKGLIIGSEGPDFCVGADIDLLHREHNAESLYGWALDTSRAFREMECLGVPVVVALTGHAIGGGLALALAGHHRIALDDPGIRMGIPGLELGLLPALGATQRLPRMLGFQAAFEILLQSRRMGVSDARKAGLVDQVFSTRDEIMAAASAWILAHPGFKAPWDRSDFKPPPPLPESADARNLFFVVMASLHRKTWGCLEAPEAVVRAVQEGARLVFDRALELEARFFAQVVSGQQARAMTRTFWYHQRAADRAEGLVIATDPGIGRMGVLGAGMMGAGLAWLGARGGWDVVLRDIHAAALEKAMQRCQAEAAKDKRLDANARQAALARIHPTQDLGDLRGCDLVIEAVFEDMALKHRIFRDLEVLLPDSALIASNTSALPITELARVLSRPQNFVGLHFFSPVERMPLLEIIRGTDTSEATIARALAVSKVLGKTPIVVWDGFGFYTTRVFASYILEGAQLVAEGCPPALIEQAARLAGMAVPPLQVFDEITLTLGKHVAGPAKRYLGDRLPSQGVALVTRMVDELDRTGRAAGRGFYEYAPDGKRLGLWSGLAELAHGTPHMDASEIGRRLLLVQAAEVARTWDEGIVRRHRDAELGAILGLGFAPGTGGPLAWMDSQGLVALVEEMTKMAASHGSRFAPAPGLVEMARKGSRFYMD